jgi:hypothetical protein
VGGGKWFEYCKFIVFIFLSCFVIIFPGYAKDEPYKVHRLYDKPMDNLYFHAVIGCGPDVFESNKIENIVQGHTIDPFGFSFQAGLRGGVRRIFQIEYTANLSFDHPMIKNNYKISMKLWSHETLFKINPAIWIWTKPINKESIECIFLVFGTSNVSYRDKYGNGFKGTGKLYGLEWARFEKNISFSVGVTYQDLKFNTVSVFGFDFPDNIDALRCSLYMRLGIGWSI